MPVSEVISLLRESKRPLIHVGQGIRGCVDDFMALIEAHLIPFVTARNANDICASDHALFVGRPGTFGQRGANFAVQTCDLYIAIGTSLSLTQCGYATKDYARTARIVRMDSPLHLLAAPSLPHNFRYFFFRERAFRRREFARNIARLVIKFCRDVLV